MTVVLKPLPFLNDIALEFYDAERENGQVYGTQGGESYQNTCIFSLVSNRCSLKYVSKKATEQILNKNVYCITRTLLKCLDPMLTLY